MSDLMIPNDTVLVSGNGSDADDVESVDYLSEQSENFFDMSDEEDEYIPDCELFPTNKLALIEDKYKHFLHQTIPNYEEFFRQTIKHFSSLNIQWNESHYDKMVIAFKNKWKKDCLKSIDMIFSKGHVNVESTTVTSGPVNVELTSIEALIVKVELQIVEPLKQDWMTFIGSQIMAFMKAFHHKMTKYNPAFKSIESLLRSFFSWIMSLLPVTFN